MSISAVTERFYQGRVFSLGTAPSRFVPGKRVVILGKYRANKKTGMVVQLAFLDADVSPADEHQQAQLDSTHKSAQGCDQSSCGAFSACYVKAFPLHMLSLNRQWHDWQAGKIERIPSKLVKSLFSGKVIRFGEYGDPASVSVDTLKGLATYARSHLGYTHAWRTCSGRYAEYCMASVESADDYRAAVSKGYRPFLIVPRATTRADILASIPGQSSPTPCVHDINGTQCAACPTPCNGTTWVGRTSGIYVIGHGANQAKLLS